MLIAFFVLIGEHVDDFNFVAGGSQRLKFVLKEDRIFRPVAEYDGQVEVFGAVRDGFGHGKEWCDAAATGESDDVFRVPEILIIEISLGTGGCELVSDSCICKKIVGCKSVRLGLHCDRQSAFESFFRSGADRVWPGNKTLADLHLE